jgi:DNA-binding PadR family transcriptional regulator
MSTTRLLILGVVRIFQPVHGYFVRRELLSWRAEQWANINPGSIYNALRTLSKEGFLEEVSEPQEAGARPKTSYRLTPDGEAEFMTMLRDAFWALNEYAPDLMYAAVGFMTFLPRDEVIAALEHRVAQIEALKAGLDYKAQALRKTDTNPAHTHEIVLLGMARANGELEWTHQLLARLRAGEYEFDDDAAERA